MAELWEILRWHTHGGYCIGSPVGDTVVAHPWGILDGRTVDDTGVAQPWGILIWQDCERYCDGTPMGDT